MFHTFFYFSALKDIFLNAQNTLNVSFAALAQFIYFSLIFIFIFIFIFNIIGHDPEAIFIDTNNQVSILMYLYWIFIYSTEAKCIKMQIYIDSGDTAIATRYYKIIIYV